IGGRSGPERGEGLLGNGDDPPSAKARCLMDLQLQEQKESSVQERLAAAQAPPLRLAGVAVVGLGYWGPNWVRVINQIHCAGRIVCCDFSQRLLESVGHLYPAVHLTDEIEEVLADAE